MVLLITFNHEPRVDNIVALRHLYSEYLANIVFYGDNITSYVKSVQGASKVFDDYTLVDFYTHIGYNHYYCMTRVIEMGFQTDGILLISDDLLIMPFNFNFSLSNVWFVDNSSMICEDFRIAKQALVRVQSNIISSRTT
jgi:hypothetical protein